MADSLTNQRNLTESLPVGGGLLDSGDCIYHLSAYEAVLRVASLDVVVLRVGSFELSLT